MQSGNLVSENYSHPGRDLTRFPPQCILGSVVCCVPEALRADGFSSEKLPPWKEASVLFHHLRSRLGGLRRCSLEGFNCCQGCFSWWVSRQAIVRFPFLGSELLKAEEDGVYFHSRVQKTIVDSRG